MARGTPASGKIWHAYPGRKDGARFYIFGLRAAVEIYGNGYMSFDLLHLPPHGDRHSVIHKHVVNIMDGELDVAFEDATDEDVIAFTTHALLEGLD